MRRSERQQLKLNQVMQVAYGDPELSWAQIFE